MEIQGCSSESVMLTWDRQEQSTCNLALSISTILDASVTSVFPGCCSRPYF